MHRILYIMYNVLYNKYKHLRQVGQAKMEGSIKVKALKIISKYRINALLNTKNII